MSRTYSFALSSSPSVPTAYCTRLLAIAQAESCDDGVHTPWMAGAFIHFDFAWCAGFVQDVVVCYGFVSQNVELGTMDRAGSEVGVG